MFSQFEMYCLGELHVHKCY